MKRLVKISMLLLFIFIVLFSKPYVLKTAFPKPYRNKVEEVSKKFDVDNLLVYSVMRAESRYDENALSDAGAKGLMQLTEDTFELVTNNLDYINNIYEYSDNIEAGIWYLGYLKKNLDNDPQKYVRAYNCGMNSIDKLYPQTEIFADRVFYFYEIYKNIY